MQNVSASSLSLKREGRVVTSIICHAGYFSRCYTVSPWRTPHWYSGWQEQPLGVSGPSPAEEIHFGIHTLICVLWLRQLFWLFWWMKKVLWWSTFNCMCLHPKRGDLCVFLLFNFIWEGSAEPPPNKSQPFEFGFALVENCTRSIPVKMSSHHWSPWRSLQMYIPGGNLFFLFLTNLNQRPLEAHKLLQHNFYSSYDCHLYCWLWCDLGIWEALWNPHLFCLRMWWIRIQALLFWRRPQTFTRAILPQ